MFARFGSTVTVIEMLPAHPAPRRRGDLGRGAQGPRPSRWRSTRGPRPRPRSRPRTASRSASAPRRASRRRSPPSCCCVAVGRGPVTDGLNLESTKVAARPRLRQDEPPDGDGRAGHLRDRRRGRAARPAAPAARARGLRRGHRRRRAPGRPRRRGASTTTASPPPPTAGPRRPASASPRPRRRSAATTCASAASTSATWPSRASSATPRAW